MSIIPSGVALAICIICGTLCGCAIFILILEGLRGDREVLAALVILGAVGYFLGVKPLQDKAARNDQRIAQLLDTTYPEMKAIHVKEGREVSYHVRSEPNFVCYAEIRFQHGKPTITITSGGTYCDQLSVA